MEIQQKPWKQPRLGRPDQDTRTMKKLVGPVTNAVEADNNPQEIMIRAIQAARRPFPG